MVAAVCVIPDDVKPVGVPHAGGVPIVKLVFEMSKKIFPTDSILIRLVVPCVAGTVTVSVPSLAVEEAKTVGNVLPPSVDKRMFTAWQFTEPALVPFTAHVTVAVPPALQVMFVFGEVTW